MRYLDGRRSSDRLTDRSTVRDRNNLHPLICVRQFDNSFLCFIGVITVEDLNSGRILPFRKERDVILLGVSNGGFRQQMRSNLPSTT